MGLAVHTDHDAIRSALDERVAADPVRGTTLGTLGRQLEDTAWLATDGTAFAVRSSARFPVVLGGPWAADPLDELVGLVRDLPSVFGLSGDAATVGAAVTRLGADVARREEQRLFRLDELTPPGDVAGHGTVADESHAEVVREWFAAFMVVAHRDAIDAREPADRALADRGVWLWCRQDGTPVSLAARRPVIHGSARIGPVYTPPAERGHGYGSAVTAAATRSVLDDGGVPVLFTDLANPTSNKIYAAIGYVPVEDRVLVVLG